MTMQAKYMSFTLSHTHTQHTHKSLFTYHTPTENSGTFDWEWMSSEEIFFQKKKIGNGKIREMII